MRTMSLINRRMLGLCLVLGVLTSGCPGGGDSSSPGTTASACTTPSTRTAEGNGITPVTTGVAADYSPVLNKLSFMRYRSDILSADNTGTYELYVTSPDGSNAVCISCTDIPGGPRANQHKGAQQWHPNGQWMVGVVEMPAHGSTHASVTPGTGLQNDIYAISADGTQWVKLTSYVAVLGPTTWPGAFIPWTTPAGALVPRFNKSGSKVIWGEEIGWAPLPSPYSFGVQRIAVADFVIVGGVPQLQNTGTYTLPSHVMNGGTNTFYEPWSPNGDGTLMAIATDHNTVNPAILDMYRFNLSTGQVTLKLSPSPEAFQWEEQAQFSPNGSRIAYMTTADHTPPYQAANFIATFRIDLWLMNADGSNKTRLLRFTDATRAEFQGSDAYGIPGTWKDNRSFYYELNRMGASSQLLDQSAIYLFTLAQ